MDLDKFHELISELVETQVQSTVAIICKDILSEAEMIQKSADVREDNQVQSSMAAVLRLMADQINKKHNPKSYIAKVKT